MAWCWHLLFVKGMVEREPGGNTVMHGDSRTPSGQPPSLLMSGVMVVAPFIAGESREADASKTVAPKGAGAQGGQIA